MTLPAGDSMRIFQVSGTRPAYTERLGRLTAQDASFDDLLAAFHHDAYEAVHTLEPVLNGSRAAFYTHSNNERLQRAWAAEKGLPADASLDAILLAQVEEHRPDVFYTLNTISVDSALARRLPGCVKAKIGWHAAPLTGNDMSAYLMVCNFETLLETYRAMGLRTAFFSPSHDPLLDTYASVTRRDIDVLFVGTYSRWHKSRAAILEAVAALQSQHNLVYSLYQSRLNRLAETPLGWLGPLKKHARPRAVRAIAQPPVFGRDYYNLLSRAKIVLNGAGDIGGLDRGNMRCWEALGAGALMVSDAGNYPEGMVDGTTIRTYRSQEEAVAVIRHALQNPGERQSIADAGNDMVRTRYSKARQWADFQKLVADHF